MPATASGEIKIRIVHQPQKNGDIYVLERRTLYDPVSFKFKAGFRCSHRLSF